MSARTIDQVLQDIELIVLDNVDDADTRSLYYGLQKELLELTKKADAVGTDGLSVSDEVTHMIENKEEYLAKWQTLFDKQNDVLNDLAEVNEMFEKYGAVNLGDLVDRLQEEADKAADEFNEYTKEAAEIIAKIHSEFSAQQIEAWIAMGYSHIDIVYAYLQGKIDDYKMLTGEKHGTETEENS